MSINRTRVSFEDAEAIAIKALAFLSSDMDLMSRFLALSGLDLSDLRDVAGESGFQAALLDFLLSDDSLILTFASNNGFAPEDVMLAKHRLDPMSQASTGAF